MFSRYRKTLECSFFGLFAASGGALLWCTQCQTNYITETMSNIVGIPMPFSRRGVCLIPYCGPMPYTMQFPAHRIGGQVELCLTRGYALSEVCLKRGSTVSLFNHGGFWHQLGTDLNIWANKVVHISGRFKIVNRCRRERSRKFQYCSCFQWKYILFTIRHKPIQGKAEQQPTNVRRLYNKLYGTKWCGTSYNICLSKKLDKYHFMYCKTHVRIAVCSN